MVGTVSGSDDRLQLAGISPEDKKPEGINFSNVIRPGTLASQEQPTFIVSVDSGSTWCAIRGGLDDIAAALDQRLDGYRLEQEYALHAGSAGSTVNFILAGLSAGAGAVASAFLSEIGKELWKAFKEILLSPAERIKLADRREPTITITSLENPTGSSIVRTPDSKELLIRQVESSPEETKASQDQIASKPRRGGGDRFSFTMVVDGWELHGELQGISDGVAQAEELREFLERGPAELYLTACEQFLTSTGNDVPTKLDWSGRNWVPSARRPSYRPAPRR